MNHLMIFSALLCFSFATKENVEDFPNVWSQKLIAELKRQLQNMEGSSDIDDEPPCKFSVNQGSIIRTRDSLDAGAQFLSSENTASMEECQEMCCKKEDSCNLAVFKEKGDQSCYLFDCKQPSVCNFTKHEGYVVMSMAKKEVKVTGSHGPEMHANDLEKLANSVKTTPEPTTTTTTTSTTTTTTLPTTTTTEAKEPDTEDTTPVQLPSKQDDSDRQPVPPQEPKNSASTNTIQDGMRKPPNDAGGNVGTPEQSEESKDDSENMSLPESKEEVSVESTAASKELSAEGEVHSGDTGKVLEVGSIDSEISKEEELVVVQSSKGAVICLALGLFVTALLLVFVGCRLRNVKRKLRRGRPLSQNEADYLINGMYL